MAYRRIQKFVLKVITGNQPLWVLRYCTPSVIYRAYQCLFTFRKKVIGLDDLLDYFETGKDKLKVQRNESNANGSRGYGSDDENMDVRENEIKFCKIFKNCEEEVIV